MNNFYKKLSVLIIIMVAIYISIVYSNSRFKKTNIEISPYSDKFKINLDVYYVDENFLLKKNSVQVKVQMHNYLETIFDLLKKKSWHSTLTLFMSENVKLLNYSIDYKTVKLNISNDILNTDLWKNGNELVIIYSIVNTFTSMDNFDKVILNVDGVSIDKYTQKLTTNELKFNGELINKNLKKLK
ncbi:MAG: hypothetical protein CSB15_01415 [Clostridiales bacterium]|nr:MAG: hypothetical protein CSB15_01415 [Clostridiales bacterium]